MIIVGIDFQNTITADEKIFRKLAEGLIATGNTVYIITAVKRHNMFKRIKEIKKSKVPHAHAELIPYNDHTEIPQLKLEACRRLGVRLMIDDNQATCDLLKANKILALRVT